MFRFQQTNNLRFVGKSYIWSIVFMKEKMTDKHSYAIKMLLFFITSCGKALSLLRQFKSDCILRRDSALSSFNSSAFIVATRFFVATVGKPTRQHSHHQKGLSFAGKNGKKGYLERQLKRHTHVYIFFRNNHIADTLKMRREPSVYVRI